jgi:CubicO group peptidase (beta-lactamase class C family)
MRRILVWSAGQLTRSRAAFAKYVMKVCGQAGERNPRALRRACWCTCSLSLAILMAILSAGCGGGSSNGAGGASTGSPPAVSSCPPSSVSPSPAGSVGAIVDNLITTEMQKEALPGIEVELAKQGNLVYAQGYGYADASTCLPTQTDTAFPISAVTEQFTAAAILQLQNSGALDIDDPVIKYPPSYPFDSRITLRMLLNHTSARELHEFRRLLCMARGRCLGADRPYGCRRCGCRIRARVRVPKQQQ